MNEWTQVLYKGFTIRNEGGLFHAFDQSWSLGFAATLELAKQTVDEYLPPDDIDVFFKMWELSSWTINQATKKQQDTGTNFKSYWRTNVTAQRLLNLH